MHTDIWFQGIINLGLAENSLCEDIITERVGETHG